MTAIDPRAYDRVVVTFSGGKDSLACLLHLLELGVAPARLELHHHEVDAGGPSFMDWPVTPAYSLGWRRLSCRCCIFGSPDQWATIRALYPETFAEIAAREARSGCTIQRRASVVALADRGIPYPAALAQPALARLAAGTAWSLPATERPWRLPAGAFGEAAGPS